MPFSLPPLFSQPGNKRNELNLESQPCLRLRKARFQHLQIHRPSLHVVLLNKP